MSANVDGVDYLRFPIYWNATASKQKQVNSGVQKQSADFMRKEVYLDVIIYF